MQYREYLLEKSEVVADEDNKSTKKDVSYFIDAITRKFRNVIADNEDQPQANTGKTGNASEDAAANNDPFADNIKKTNEPAKKNASAADNDNLKETTAYSVVEFFYLNYRWLHHAFYTVLLLILAGWFFLLPGYRMMNEKTKINVK